MISKNQKYQQKWRTKNKKYLKEYNKKWKIRNRKHYNKTKRMWVFHNKEKNSECGKKWRAKNKKWCTEYSKQYRITHKKERKEYKIKHKKYNQECYFKTKYGINLKQLKNILLLQNNNCLICNNKFNKFNKPHIDHNHITSKIRGLLCFNCNAGLGLLKADQGTKILHNAIKYIEKNSNK